jgi:hypothetical protein
MSAEMTPENAHALRKPFDKKSVGKLPKGGVMLDYVGHAATTDCLLGVDPEWTWEPLAFDPAGLPAIDAAGNLWIKLTVCGVTRIGVGDGKNMKERIGDAIRNAAMRFGVALDLWSKEELEQVAGADVHKATAEKRATRPAPKANPDEPMRDKTRAQMFALFGERGIHDEDQQRAGIGAVIGREIASRGELSEDEALAVIRSLRGGGE